MQKLSSSMQEGGLGAAQDSAAEVRVSHFGNEVSNHGSTPNLRKQGSERAAVEVRDMDAGNDQIINFVNSGHQDGRNAAYVLYS